MPSLRPATGSSHAVKTGQVIRPRTAARADRQEETSLIFLGKSRCDRNTDRLSTLSEIEAALADYGT